MADALELAIREGLDPDASKRLLDGQAVVTAENMFTVLSKLRDVCGRRPALIFDQLDDYQNRHMERFLNSEHGEVISADELSGRNPFWRDVRTGCLESGFHCVFSIRSDAGAGLAAVQFAAPKQRPLHGLAQGDVKTLIENLIGTQAVANPENGFEALKSRLADELSDGRERPVLPIQMRVVLGGLKRLKRLTPRDFDRANGLVGLEAAYVDQRVNKTDNPSQALSLLSRLVVEKGNDLGTESKTVSQLSKECGVESGALQAILETLEANNIVRRRAGKAHGEAWQLYHDYLARAVKALERKDRKWEDHLRESAKSHERASSLWAKWRTLLGPGRQIQILFEKLRGKLVYGPDTGYAQESLPRLLLNTWCVGAVVIGLAAAIYWVDQRATEIVGAFNADDEMDSAEVQRVWDLATSSGWVRQTALKRFLSNARYAEYFLGNEEPLVQAAVGLDAELANGIASSVLEGSCYERSPENSSIIRACMSLALYSDQDASRAAIFAVDTMGKTTYPPALGTLGQGLGALGERLDPAVAWQGAEAIVAAMGKTTSPSVLRTLGRGLGALGERLDPAGARQGAEAIVAAMGKTTSPSALGTLGRGLGALGERLDPGVARQGAGAIVAAMGKTTSPLALGTLGQGLRALGERLDPAVARQGAEAIVAAMGKTTDRSALWVLGEELGALGERLDLAGARQVAEAIVAAMGKTTDASALGRLGEGLGALGERLDPAVARQGAEAIVAAMGKTTNASALGRLGEGLGALGERLDPAVVRQGAEAIVAAMGKTTNPSAIRSLGRTLGALGERLDPAGARQVAEAIVAAMGKTTNPSAIRSLGRTLGALGERLDPAGARQSAEAIIATTKALANPPCSALTGLARKDKIPLIWLSTLL